MKIVRSIGEQLREIGRPAAVTRVMDGDWVKGPRGSWLIGRSNRSNRYSRVGTEPMIITEPRGSQPWWYYGRELRLDPISRPSSTTGRARFAEPQRRQATKPGVRGAPGYSRE